MEKESLPKCKSTFCKIWNHYLNPFGNWNEPTPYPSKRVKNAEDSWMPSWLWWAQRNPLHNLTHYWLGITPLTEDGSWKTPEEDGWIKEKKDDSNFSFWKKDGKIPRPYFRYDGDWTFYFGWTSRGNLGAALRKNHGENS